MRPPPRTETEAWPESYGAEAQPRMGFFTDTSVCIGCKACEVACKEWNLVPEDGMVWSGESFGTPWSSPQSAAPNRDHAAEHPHHAGARKPGPHDPAAPGS